MDTFDQSTSLSMFKRNATVAYDGRNFTILGTESISPPEPVAIGNLAADLKRIHDKALNATSNGTSDDTAMANALVFQLCWVLRLYQDNFPSTKQNPLDILRGFLSVPFVFSTVVWVYANITVSTQLAAGAMAIPLPRDLETTASPADASFRAIAEPRTVHVFSAAVAILVLLGWYLLAMTLIRKTVAPNASSFLEIDVSSKSAFENPRGTLNGEVVPNSPENLYTMLRNAGLGNAESGAILKEAQNKRVRVASLTDGEDGNRHLVLIIGTDNAEGRAELRNNTIVRSLDRRCKYD